MYIYIYLQMVSFRLLEQTCFLQIMSCRRRTYYNPQPNFETRRKQMRQNQRFGPRCPTVCGKPARRYPPAHNLHKFSVGQKMQLRLVPVAFHTCFLCFFFHVVCFGWFAFAVSGGSKKPTYGAGTALTHETGCYFEVLCATFQLSKHTVYQTSAD